MADEPQTTSSSVPRASFSPRRKWGIALDLIVRTAFVLAVVAMLNHLAGRHFYRKQLSSQTRNELTPRTVGLLHSFTNEVKVTVYYDKEDQFYSMIVGMLNEFHIVNPHIRVTTVDPLHDPGAAVKLKQTYELGTATNRNFIIFDCEGGGKYFVPGGMLMDIDINRLPDEQKELRFERKATAFRGEMAFASALIAVTSPKPLKAYFLRDHGEHLITNGDDATGYLKFSSVLQQNYVRTLPLSLAGTNNVPQDCNLLIVAGAVIPIPEAELEKIDQYLNQGGRLLVMFSALAGNRPIGLEKVLARWNIQVSASEVRDVENSRDANGLYPVVSDFGPKPHPVMSPLVNLSLHLVLPRPVGALRADDHASDTLNLQELAFTGEHAVLGGSSPSKPQRYPLAVAVERGLVKGIITERGTTRMIVVGDSNFLGNEMIESAGNREFAHAAVNWLLDRPQLLVGVGPRPIAQYRITMTQSQTRNVQWVLLAAVPGAILLLGGLVWLRRRK